MEVLRESREDALNAPGDHFNEVHGFNPPDEGANQTQSDSVQGSSIYTMAYDQSLMSRQVERWMGRVSPVQTTGIQGSRPTLVQRSTLATDLDTSLSGSGIWCALAFMMPLLNIADVTRWRCSQNTLLNFVELISSPMVNACDRIRCNIRSLAVSNVTREIFASAMDVVLVLYAIGFLFLSIYQASISA